MSVYFIGCLHLGHKNMAKHRGFSNVCAHDFSVIEGINSIMTKRDKLFILGDISMENRKSYHMLRLVPGVKHVVLGNHDRHQDTAELLKYVNYISGAVRYKDAWLTHIPVHPSALSHGVETNIHAHVHENDVGDPRYVNVDAHKLGYLPRPWSDIHQGTEKEGGGEQ